MSDRRPGILMRRLNNSRIRARLIPADGAIYSGTTVYMGSVDGAFTDTDTTFTMDNLTKLGGPITTTDSSITVQNTFDWEGDDNATCFAVWNQKDRQWEAIQVACTA